MTAPQEPLVTHLKRAGEQVLGAKPLTGNDHVRLSALLKVAALEVEALRAAEGVARDDAAELRAAIREWSKANRACSQWVAGTVGNDQDELPLARLSRAERHLHALAAAEEDS